MVLDLIQQLILHTQMEENGRNAIIFGADLSNSTAHANNKTQSVLVLGRGLIQKINETSIYAEKMYSPILLLITKYFV